MPKPRIDPARRAVGEGTSAASPGTMPAPLNRYRLDVLARAVLAIAGGYALAAASAVAMGLWLPALGWLVRADAVVLGTMSAFVVHATAAVWVFCCRSPWKALAGIALPLAVLGIGLVATMPGGRT